MVTWDEARAVKLASMTESERAAYEAMGPQVEAELAAAELTYQMCIEAGLTQAELEACTDTQQN